MQRKREREEKQRILALSIRSANTDNLENITGHIAKSYIIRCELEVIEVTTSIIKRFKETNKENRQELKVYRAESGAIRRAHPNRT